MDSQENGPWHGKHEFIRKAKQHVICSMMSSNCSILSNQPYIEQILQKKKKKFTEDSVLLTFPLWYNLHPTCWCLPGTRKTCIFSASSMKKNGEHSQDLLHWNIQTALRGRWWDPYSVSRGKWGLEKSCACWCQNQGLNPGLSNATACCLHQDMWDFWLQPGDHLWQRNRTKLTVLGGAWTLTSPLWASVAAICEMGIWLALQSALVGIEKGQWNEIYKALSTAWNIQPFDKGETMVSSSAWWLFISLHLFPFSTACS